ncbi:hypothetical protein A5630_27420 [Mycolicibacterium mucogenicum]|uniref:HEPN AbiJ-N-terminal domain-containing protein n=1 Tax=Mycolicibacterium mucogenicum TaxID=56689 RepID=A0A1A3GV97_MYCMU|nr:hypothetical protein [Mycolicibacterium mucogenicum]OBJ39269.1 hypothetical protein A5630_27420 [Mycolicibacterium mucogenicum]
MSSFSQRYGYRETRTLVQRDELDAETRVQIWNVVVAIRKILTEPYDDDTESQVVAALWAWHFNEARDEQPTPNAVWGRVKQAVLGSEWWALFDAIEALIKYLERFKSAYLGSITTSAVGALNSVFEDYLVGYRIIEHKVTPIDSEVAASAIDDAIADTAGIEGARHHLGRAIELLSDRQNPDYANSVKESISAVESVCRTVTGQATLGAALKRLANAGVTIHPALERAWLAMYGWTSDADGIRHGGIDAADADQSLAKYMLVTCSAFISHVVEIARRADLI